MCTNSPLLFYMLCPDGHHHPQKSALKTKEKPQSVFLKTHNLGSITHRFQIWCTDFKPDAIDLQNSESKMLLARFVSAGSVYIGRVQVTTVSVKITSNFSNHLWCQKDSNVNVTECCLLKCCDPQFLPFDTQIFWQRVTWKFYGEQ